MRSVTVIRFATRAAVSCLLLGTVVKIPAVQYEVEGRIEQTVYKMDGSVQSESRSRFTVFVNGCSWLIEETNLDVDENPLGVIETAGVNNGLIYSVDMQIDLVNPFPGRSGGGLTHANIYSNNVPVSKTDFDNTGHLWLMFASGCQLKNISTNWLTPVYDLNASASVNRLLKRWAKWEWADGSGSLPTNATYFQSGAESLIDATYAATGMTNSGILKIPSGFIFEQRTAILYAPGPILPGDTTPAYHIRKLAVATVTAVRPYCSRRQFVPAAAGMTDVTDERLAGVPNSNPRMVYLFRDGLRWVSVAEAKKLSVGVATRPVPANPPSKVVVVLILFLPAAVVLSLWFLNRGKGQTPPVISNSESRNTQNSGESLAPSNTSSNP